VSNDKFETTKTPNEVLNYIIDWVAEMAVSSPADQISGSTWFLDDSSTDDLTLDLPVIIGTDHTATRVADGGRLNIIHQLVNRVTTVGGLTHERTIKVTMKRR
jgi:hypothetical protein